MLICMILIVRLYILDNQYAESHTHKKLDNVHASFYNKLA